MKYAQAWSELRMWLEDYSPIADELEMNYDDVLTFMNFLEVAYE